MLRALTYFDGIFNGIIMVILDVGTWYDFCGLDCQKGIKNLQVLWDVSLMFWTLRGLGCDISAIRGWSLTQLDVNIVGNILVNKQILIQKIIF